MDFTINYTDKEMSAWGGMKFMRRLLTKTRILDSGGNRQKEW